VGQGACPFSCPDVEWSIEKAYVAKKSRLSASRGRGGLRLNVPDHWNTNGTFEKKKPGDEGGAQSTGHVEKAGKPFGRAILRFSEVRLGGAYKERKKAALEKKSLAGLRRLGGKISLARQPVGTTSRTDLAKKELKQTNTASRHRGGRRELVPPGK